MPSSFRERVYRTLRAVPRGRVTTYAALACAAGYPRAARAVGSALNANPFIASSLPAGRRVPCHRVVRSDGSVGGFVHGTREKVRMLRREGVVVRRGTVDLRRFGWRRRPRT
jgi:methylated-DNA-[protein]-cysteine S-methyltransferase